MSDLATWMAPADDMAMSRPAKYIPPRDTSTIMLSEALRGTGRFPENKQMDFLGAGRDRSDLRIYYPDHYTSRPQESEAVKSAAVEAMAREWKIYADALGAKAYMLGDRFSILDVYAAMLVTWKTRPRIRGDGRSPAGSRT